VVGAGAEPVGEPRLNLQDFMRSAGLLSLSSVSNLLRAIVTTKLFALALGPSTVGILAQLLNFSSLMATIIPLGLTTGVSRMVARAGPDSRSLAPVVGTSAAVSLGSGIAAGILLAPFSAQISTALTGSSRYTLLVLLIAASFPLYNLAWVLAYVLQGLAAVKHLTAANVANAIVTVVLLIPLTLAFGLTGSILGVLIGSVTQALIFVVAVAHAYRLRGWPVRGLTLDRATAATLLRLGGIVLAGGIAMWGSVLIVRTVAVHRLGGHANGLYQVAYGLSSQYIAVFMTWMSAYVFPRVAREARSERIQLLLNSVLRANLMLMAPGLVLVTALRTPLIQLLYTHAFLAAAPLVGVQALGDYVRVVAWSFGVALFAQGYVRTHLVAMVVQSVAWVAATVLLLGPLGLMALPVGYLISFLTWPPLLFGTVRRFLSAGIDGENVALIALGLVALLATLFVPWPVGVLLAVPVPAAVVLFQRRQATA